jgi:transposase
MMDIDSLTILKVRHIITYINIAYPSSMKQRDPKLKRLAELGVLNAHPERVRASWFRSGDFFDARDLVQAKYEMLRHVRVDGVAKAKAALLFGMSRPTYYQAETAFAQSGLAGLLPKPRGPKGGHKLTATIMAFIEQRLRQGEPMQARLLAQALKSELGIIVHPRSIERAIARKKKR